MEIQKSSMLAHELYMKVGDGEKSSSQSIIGDELTFYKKMARAFPFSKRDFAALRGPMGALAKMWTYDSERV